MSFWSRYVCAVEVFIDFFTLKLFLKTVNSAVKSVS